MLGWDQGHTLWGADCGVLGTTVMKEAAATWFASVSAAESFPRAQAPVCLLPLPFPTASYLSLPPPSGSSLYSSSSPCLLPLL